MYIFSENRIAKDWWPLRLRVVEDQVLNDTINFFSFFQSTFSANSLALLLKHFLAFRQYHSPFPSICFYKMFKGVKVVCQHWLTTGEQGTQLVRLNQETRMAMLMDRPLAKSVWELLWCLHAQSRPDNLYSFYLRQQHTSLSSLPHITLNHKAQGLDKSSWRSVRSIMSAA